MLSFNFALSSFLFSSSLALDSEADLAGSKKERYRSYCGAHIDLLDGRLLISGFAFSFRSYFFLGN